MLLNKIGFESLYISKENLFIDTEKICSVKFDFLLANL